MFGVVRGGERHVTGKTGVDRVGVFRTYAVALELKSRNGAASFALLKLDAKHSSDRAEVEYLTAAARAGSAVGYLVRDETLSRVYLVGAEHLSALAAGGSVRLRSDLPEARPLVPCLAVPPLELVRRSAMTRPLWPWPTLFTELPHE